MAYLRPLARGRFRSVIDVDDVRSFALTLPRTTEALVRGRVKFRVGRIVYLAFSDDETIMGFAFPKEEREALVRSEPHKFLMPDRKDLRYQWVQVRLDAHRRGRDARARPRRLADGGPEGGRRRARRPRMRSEPCAARERSHAACPIDQPAALPGADDGIRTRDPHLGKVVLYH